MQNVPGKSIREILGPGPNPDLTAKIRVVEEEIINLIDTYGFELVARAYGCAYAEQGKKALDANADPIALIALVEGAQAAVRAAKAAALAYPRNRDGEATAA